jgi:hypothetical protein
MVSCCLDSDLERHQGWRPHRWHQLCKPIQPIAALDINLQVDPQFKVRCQLDPNTYPVGIKVSNAELEAVNLSRHDFHGDWNYTISPKPLLLEQ